jgi:hypothetical protein
MKLSVSLQFIRSYTVGRTPWAGDKLVARPLPVRKHRKTHTHTQTLNIYALSGIQTHGPDFRASEESACLRPLGYRDRRAGNIASLYLMSCLNYKDYIPSNVMGSFLNGE